MKKFDLMKHNLRHQTRSFSLGAIKWAFGPKKYVSTTKLRGHSYQYAWRWFIFALKWIQKHFLEEFSNTGFVLLEPDYDIGCKYKDFKPLYVHWRKMSWLCLDLGDRSASDSLGIEMTNGMISMQCFKCFSWWFLVPGTFPLTLIYFSTQIIYWCATVRYCKVKLKQSQDVERGKFFIKFIKSDEARDIWFAESEFIRSLFRSGMASPSAVSRIQFILCVSARSGYFQLLCIVKKCWERRRIVRLLLNVFVAKFLYIFQALFTKMVRRKDARSVVRFNVDLGHDTPRIEVICSLWIMTGTWRSIMHYFLKLKWDRFRNGLSLVFWSRGWNKRP